MDPDSYGYDPLTRYATETANHRIDAMWWLKWMRNLKENDRDIRALPPVSQHFGEWSGSPCLVAGAGPSLESNISQVREAAHRGWRITAVDRAFNTLKRNGIDPDITVTSDAGPGVQDFFDKKFLRESDTFAVCVITHPSVYEKLSGCRRRVYACINPFSAFWKYVQNNYPRGLMCLRPGYVVTFSAVDLAQWMGSRLVVTIGNDLCWPSYADVDTRYKQARLMHLPDGRVTIPAFHKAARAFRFFPDHHTTVRFADASGGLVRGWEKVQLEQIVSGSDAS